MARGKRRLLAICVLMSFAVTLVRGAELEESTRRAYDVHAALARQLFLRDVSSDGSRVGEAAPEALLQAGRVVAGPGQEDGIVGVPGGLVLHWMGSVFIPDVSLDDVLDLAQTYAEYSVIYESVVASRVLCREGDTFRVLLRLEERAGIVSAVLDVWSAIRYVRVSGTRAYSVSGATEIREVVGAEQADERLLPAGEGKGYLWRANAFTKYVERDGGVYMELETLGLSRDFPRLLGWIIEPIARRIGRKSVEGSLEAFREALLGDAAASG